jgi:hypothetical protein
VAWATAEKDLTLGVATFCGDMAASIFAWPKTLILKHLRPKQNSFYLVGDGDELQLVEIIERFYGLTFPPEELRDVATFGQLFDVVVRMRQLRGDEFNTRDTWNELVEIVVGFSGHRASVDRDTTFIASWA